METIPKHDPPGGILTENTSATPPPEEPATDGSLSPEPVDPTYRSYWIFAPHVAVWVLGDQPVTIEDI